MTSAGDAPSERIDPRALRAWRVRGAIEGGIVIATAGLASWLVVRFQLPWLLIVLVWVVALVAAWVLAWLVPRIRWERWRYRIGERQIELQRGVLVITRTLIPLARVQHVDTKQGPILRFYGLASVAIATAAGTAEIPALAVDEAQRLRDQIAQLAGVSEDV
ncbi:PH domain-containing protein [Thermomicrobium sp.]|jgi:membrane protein YdbS with pleckstrin-like domain|uniref:PH domain-containing protein n=1 Tax=Thermomicrobium sp. TaxID=1969469 RepID=UPI001B1C7941|nr:PH domain-containing protein [Thermomicrobium sp.]MBO9307827.1 PH domain-containing protein [Thermomicrobium sp.]MBO9360367.1 PH domain-containing protein [Thermomicrobium sp.]MBO9387074.1 PH domain-containing protein [Thermomicrobium sp.]